MNKLLAGVLMPYLTALPYADLVGGLSQTIETGGRAEGSSPRRRFPASYQTAGPSAKVLAVNEYADLTPNEAFKSILFIEGLACNVTGREKGLIHFKSVVRVVGWVNARKAEINEVQALVPLLKALPEGSFNGKGLQRIRIESTKILDDKAAFARYTFDEASRQYLMLPFFGFAVDLEVTYAINPDPSCL